MQDFYNDYYAAIEHSQAHAAFCERVFGRNLGQHGFMDMQQLELLLTVTRLGPQSRVLDLGCGNGLIAEYISDCTGAHVAGMDYIPEAIRQAQERTIAKADRLGFFVGDISQLELASRAFDTILSIDTLYFCQDYAATIRQLKAALEPNGQMAILFSHGREPWVSKEEFPKETLPPDKTPLADALKANGFAFRTWDLTQQDYQLARLRKQVLVELRPQFEAEEILFIYKNRMGDAEGISQAIEDGLHARYLYHVTRISH